MAAVLATAAVVAAPPRLAMAPVAGLLLLSASVAQQFKVKSPKHQSYYTTTIFIFSAALLLRYSLKLDAESRAIEAAVDGAIAAGYRTADVAAKGEKAASTREMADAIISRL